METESKQFDRDCYTYIFVRQDISVAQQMVQACHAAMLTPSNITRIVIFGLKDLQTLENELQRLTKKGVVCYPFFEPPMRNELTAIATKPMTKKEGQIFSHHKLWQNNGN